MKNKIFPAAHYFLGVFQQSICVHLFIRTKEFIQLSFKQQEKPVMADKYLER